MNSAFLTESSTIEEILTYAMDEEKNAEEFYQKAAALIIDKEAIVLLLSLAEKERIHYQELHKKLEKFRANIFSIHGVLESFNSHT
ncbi:MAG: hypothetical protein HOB40_10580 [Candidatus Marinimicrobia bacterium]|nr:hypothetical protein [Candidatus Neomarinimicrobiota bacterium]MBT3839990.1 hypothetical protein [Candidatus Neomarinimicrobiota bacterium]MBT3999262.1 hypothetical protein [Candidatus Neomarinimicrobiota bacterium]MBT4282179.1 hypothetical protein [Candidatus Neomarinimicrobiota bacterium]MBT4579863.1 hypothetical protein [Candidatus Neomarinimicrobiota bacterium]